MEKIHSQGWVNASKETNKRLFSELNVLLRGLERFFDPEGLSSHKETHINRNFFNELNAAKNVSLRVLGILEVVIPESRKNAYWFQKYAESKYLNEKKRDFLKDEMYRQDTPEKSILLLYDSFINVKGILTDILRSNFISYMSFINAGELIGRGIRGNVHFNPFKKDIDPEFDAIEMKEVSEIVKGIADRNTKKAVSVLFLHLYKFLRYLSHVDITTQRQVSLYCSVIILLLLKSEIELFLSYAKRVRGRLGGEIGGIAESLSFQFSMETRRVYVQELRDILSEGQPQRMRGRVENSHGILRNLTEQCIMQLAQFWTPGIDGMKIFESYMTKLGQSLRLREDIYVLGRLVHLLDGAADGPPDEKQRAFSALVNYMVYFESFTFKLLRYDDYEEFSAFFAKIGRLRRREMNDGDFLKALGVCRHFSIFLDTCLGAVENRTELKGRPLDRESGDSTVRQYLSGKA